MIALQKIENPVAVIERKPKGFSDEEEEQEETWRDDYLHIIGFLDLDFGSRGSNSKYVVVFRFFHHRNQLEILPPDRSSIENKKSDIQNIREK